MIGRILFQLFLFALPFLLYGGWVAFVRKQDEASGGRWNDAPATWLIVAGLTLSFLGFIAMSFMGGSDPGGSYIPPRYEDGRVVPSEVR